MLSIRFRVKAVNEVGSSEPSDVTEPVAPVEIVEAPTFELDAELRQSLTVRAGGSIRLFVTVKGRPTPKVSWSKENGLPEHRCNIDTTSSYR